MKKKLAILVLVTFSCIILGFLALYISDIRNSSVPNSETYALAGSGITLTGVNKDGSPYKIEINNVAQKDRITYELDSILIDLIDSATRAKRNFNIKCKTMVLHYNKDTSSNTGLYGAVEKIVFTDGVTITSEDKIGYGDTAEFLLKDDIVTLQGNAAMKDKNSYITGDHLIYNPKTGIFTIKGRTKVLVK